jgi:protein-S-isoprenylcysteine O-methyltransferase Ste14
VDLADLVLLLRAASFFVIQVTAVALVPFLLSSWSPHLSLGALRYSGALLLLCGGIGILWSDWLFARQGRGTPAPYDPPRALVVFGLYRTVRNPMYGGAAAFVFGLALLTQSVWVLAYAALVAGTCHVWLLLIEEPQLRARFGAQYEAYCRLVPRWVPRWPPIPRGSPTAVRPGGHW